MKRYLLAVLIIVLVALGVVAQKPGGSSFLLQIQNAGSTIASFGGFGKINCSTGMVCSASGSTVTITSSGAGTGVVGANNGTAGALANYAAAAGSTTVGPDATLSDNGSTLTYGGTILSMAGATATINTTGTNVGLTLAPNGTGPVIFNAGLLATPSIQTTGMAANTGFFSSGTTNFCWDSAGTSKTCFVASGLELSNGGVFSFSSTAGGSGAIDTTASRLGAGVIQFNSGTGAGSAGFTKSGMTVTTAADVTCGTGGTISSCTAATTVTGLTFTLPLVATNWGMDCDLVVGQATAATANQWLIQTATNGVTSTTASYEMGTAATAVAFGAVTDQGTTTTAFQIAPSWTLGGTATKMPVHIHAFFTGVSASGTVINLQVIAPTVADLLTIYEGAKCTLNP